MSDELPFMAHELIESLDFLRSKSASPALPLRGRACSDCAVKCGFYTVFSEALKLTDKEEQLSLSRRWFCHETPSRACRGNSDYLGISNLFNTDK